MIHAEDHAAHCRMAKEIIIIGMVVILKIRMVIMMTMIMMTMVLMF